MPLFVPLDVDYQFDPKIIAAGPLSESLFVRSLALAKRTMTDGRIDATQLPILALGLPGSPKKHAETLVRVGLWTTTAGGWVISAWLKWNGSAAAIQEKAENKKAASTLANHTRWHTGEEGKKSTSCPLCYPSRIPSGVRSGSSSESKETEVEEESQAEEEKESVVGSSQLELASTPPPRGLTTDDVLEAALKLAADRSEIRSNRDGYIGKLRADWLERRLPLLAEITALHADVNRAAGAFCDTISIRSAGAAPAAAPRPTNITGATEYGRSAAQSEIRDGIDLDLDGFIDALPAGGDEWRAIAVVAYEAEHAGATTATVHQLRKAQP